VTVGVALIGTTVLSAFGSSGAGAFGLGVKALVLLASVAMNAGAFILAFRIATTRKLSVRGVAPGAVAAAVIWQLLQSFGTVYVGHVIKKASATNGVFALVLLTVCKMCNVLRPSRSSFQTTTVSPSRT
jgi:membrane protein